MTQEDVIRMAEEAGFKMENSAAIQAAEAFAKLVATHEREACAKVCEYLHDSWRFGDGEDATSGPKDCAKAIRARGNT